MLIHKSKSKQEDLIEQVINLLKNHENVKALFNKFEIDIEYIEKVSITFDDIDVSAKAKGNKIVISSRFLEDGNIVDDLHYIVHELVHVLQFLTGLTEKIKKYKFKNYLSNPLELQAFSEQIKFIREYKDDDEAEAYLKQLLDFHEVSGAGRDVKERLLRG